MGKKKGFGIAEALTSIKRHFNNVVTDPSKQRMFDVFLGIFIPYENPGTPIWALDERLADLAAAKNVVQVNGPKWYLPYA